VFKNITKVQPYHEIGPIGIGWAAIWSWADGSELWHLSSGVRLEAALGRNHRARWHSEWWCLSSGVAVLELLQYIIEHKDKLNTMFENIIQVQPYHEVDPREVVCHHHHQSQSQTDLWRLSSDIAELELLQYIREHRDIINTVFDNITKVQSYHSIFSLGMGWAASWSWQLSWTDSFGKL